MFLRSTCKKDIIINVARVCIMQYANEAYASNIKVANTA